MKYIIVLGVYVMGFTNFVCAATANVSQVVFTTEPRAVDPSTLSEAITVQSQNASNEEEKMDSTADVTFSSNSATGEFLGSTGKPVTKTMNSGSANKTFYYKDSAVGAHVITIQVVPRSGGAGWTVQQTIYVGVEREDTEDAEDETDNGSGEETTQSGSTSNSKSSAHSGSVKTGTYSKSSALKVGAGRNRTALIHTPLNFEAEVNQGNKNISPKIEYKWSFGDGDSAVGKHTQHVYYFPGEYNVLLTARSRNEVAVTRIKVKVIDNVISIASSSPGVNGFVEFTNSSSQEVNINGWELRSGSRAHVVSVDTIIDGKSSVRIPNKILGFEVLDEVELLFPTNEVALTYDPKKPTTVETPQKQIAVQVPEVTAPLLVEPEVEEIELVAQVPESRNYATTVQAAVAVPEQSWWSYIKSFFSVE